MTAFFDKRCLEPASSFKIYRRRYGIFKLRGKDHLAINTKMNGKNRKLQHSRINATAEEEKRCCVVVVFLQQKH